MNWNYNTSKNYINNELNKLNTISIKDYVKEKDLENITLTEAYKIDGVHLYLEITNIEDVLNTTDFEGVKAHKETLRILDLFYRLGTIVLEDAGAILVDFHNERLHAVFTKPYGVNNEKQRILNSIECADFMHKIMKKAHETIPKLPQLQIKAGIDSGLCLAVNNGRHGYRHPLFLGNAANHAAKILRSNKYPSGIFITSDLVKKLDLNTEDFISEGEQGVKLLKNYLDNIKITLDSDNILKKWQNSVDNYSLDDIEFTRTSHPIKNLKFYDDKNPLTPLNSKRQELLSIYADVSGFTKYINQNIENNSEDLVRIFHVIKAEFDRVLKDHGGKRVRFIGDCIHGIIFNGTAKSTDSQESVSECTNLAASIRSSFNVICEVLSEKEFNVANLGLTIGFEYGPITITGLGPRNNRVVCTIGRAILDSEKQQHRCKTPETAIGVNAYKQANENIQDLFADDKKNNDLTIEYLKIFLADKGNGEAIKSLVTGGLSSLISNKNDFSEQKYWMQLSNNKQ